MNDLKPNERLKIALARQGLSQRAVAFELGVSESVLSMFFKHGIGSEELKFQIADALGLTPAEIGTARL